MAPSSTPGSSSPDGEWVHLIPPVSNAQASITSKFGPRDKSHLRPVAVCGVALRLPGGINSTEGLWEALRQGKDMRSLVPQSRYNREGFGDSIGNKGAIKTQYGYFLEQDLACFDSSLFSLTEEETKRTDPQQRLLLEVVKECFENAGETNYKGGNIGCYVGTFGEDWLHSQSKEDQHSGGYIMSGQIDIMLANRVSYENDLRGPSMVIKTGCSASLIALHEACRSLQMNDCAGAIVAGTNLILGPTLTTAMTTEGILSPEGSCKTFDSEADGFARGEAITAVYLKLLDTAVDECLPIRAVIANTGVNCDGRSQSLLQPSAEAQISLMRKVHGDIGSDPARTAFVECHGTGTPTGDPIETTAVGQVFGNKGVYIGSIKPNLGHSEGASGLSSLLKSIVMLEKGMIIPNIKFNSPNPKIEFDRYKLEVPQRLITWPRERDLRVAINSFGIGGSNVHVIVEHPYTYLTTVPKPYYSSGHRSPQLLLMSASTPSTLHTLWENYETYIKAHPNSSRNLAYTLACRREHRQHRTFSIYAGDDRLTTAPIIKSSAEGTGVIMIFSGQGAQWPQMGLDLLHDNAEFLETIEALDGILKVLRYPPKWSIKTELNKGPKTSHVDRAEISQPLCTALQIALFHVLNSGGVRPVAVVGHSSGEIAAAYAAGAISMKAAITIAYYRGFITAGQGSKGGMAAIGLDPRTVNKLLKPGVVLACENSPSSTTISGDEAALLCILKEVKEHYPGVLAHRLKVDMAYHSPHIKGISTRYRQLLRDELGPNANFNKELLVPMYSSVWDQKIISAATLNADYWVSNLVSPVKFSTAISNVLQERADPLFLEIGPHSALAGALRQTCSARNVTYNYCPTLLRSSNSTQNILKTFGTLYQHGLELNWNGVIAEGEVLTDLPIYPWDHSSSYWYESRLAEAWRSRKFGHHELVGLRVLQTTDRNPSWRIMLNIEDVPWLADHKVKGDIVFPFAAYMSMVGEAFRQVTGIEAGYSIQQAAVATAMVLDEEKPLEIVTTLHSHSWTDADGAENMFRFTIASYTGSTWIQHCEGRVKPPQTPRPSEITTDALPRHVIPKTWYRDMERLGLIYGPSFRRIESLTTSTSQKHAIATVSNSTEYENHHFILHPATIDASFQVGLAALMKGRCGNMVKPEMPTLIDELEVFRGTTTINCSASFSEPHHQVSIDCVGIDGMPCLRLRGMRLTELVDDNLEPEKEIYGAVRLEWVADYDFLDKRSLVRIPTSSNHDKQIIEELALLCIVDSCGVVRDLNPSMPHLQKYRSWLERVADEASAGRHPVLKNTAKLVCLPMEERQRKIERLSKEAASSPLVSSFAEATMRIYRNMRELFTGTVDTLELLLRENNLARIYDAVSFDYSNFIRLLSDSLPNLRILEIGAGTGGTTELILRGMHRPGQFPRYAKYAFTDISAGFFPQARERFAGAPNMEFSVLDISLDPLQQGFQPNSYDLILAANVIHATPNLAHSLQNLQSLLSPGGQLVLTEFCTSFRAPNYIYGNFSGWWLGGEDGREWEPYVNVARWDKELKVAGFVGASDVVLDSAEPWQYCATIIAQKPSAPPNLAKTVTILCENFEAKFNLDILEGLKRKGLSPRFLSPRQMSLIEGDIIASIDLERSFFETINNKDFVLFQNLCRNLEGRALLWLMPPTQVDCIDPSRSQSLGMIRTARSELDLWLMTLEIEPNVDNFADLVIDIFEKVRTREDSGTLAPDREFAVHESVVKIGRYRPFEVHNDLAQSVLSTTTEEDIIPPRFAVESAETDLRAHGRALEVSITSSLFGSNTYIIHHTEQNYHSAEQRRAD
jgi:acyl transferase domain-containing protein/SAM-dependent methyltransferase